MTRKQPTWKPATSFTLTKLHPNGPKPGQSVSAWMYGKTKAYQELLDNPCNKIHDLP
jgi:hypothetical protein